MINKNTTEVLIKPEDLIVCKTDTEGSITYCNAQFMIYSGYFLEELVGEDFFSIAHSDMPKSIFRHVWKELKAYNEVCSLIKSQAKDGSYFWTFLNATPSFDADSQLIGYFIVQRSASQSAIDYFDALYRQMRAVEEKSGSDITSMDSSFQILENAAASKGGHNEFVFSYYA